MRRLRDEDGVTAVLVALMMVPLLGFGALVVDFGGIYFEVRQLQNGADAGALAIAQDCARGACGDANATATMLAGRNANDDLSDAAVAWPSASSVTVTTSTREGGGSTFLPYKLAGVLGIPSDDTFSRSATAMWGRFGGGMTIPIALCERSWDYYTESGTKLPSGPPSHVIRYATGLGAPIADYQDCTNPGGDTYPGGFGFLERDDDCMAVSTEDGWFPGSSGNNLVDPHSGCTEDELLVMLRAIIDNGQTALIPIFDMFRGTGSSGEFHVIGYGALKLEGYSINAGGPAKTYGMSPSECTGGGASCLKGYYTGFVALDGDLSTGGGSGFGATVVALTG